MRTKSMLFLGPLLGLFGLSIMCVVLFMRAPRELSPSTRLEMERVAGLSYDPGENDVALLPVIDIANIYLDSRSRRNAANKHRVDAGNADAAILLRWAVEHHKRIKTLIVQTIIERLVATLIPNKKLLYAEALLWTYGSELEVLDQLAEILPGSSRFVNGFEGTT
jgi:hypothetical protein